jgi:antitoxin ParD1/3/4
MSTTSKPSCATPPDVQAIRLVSLVGNIATVCHPWHHVGMANVEKLSVALTPDMVAEVRAAVAGGDYGSVSEVVRDALRDWRLRRRIETLETEELRRLVQEGIDSGPGLEADAVFARLRARFGQPPAK